MVATALLALRYFRRNDDRVAAGFLVFLAGESLLLSGTAAALENSVSSFAGGVALWSAVLTLTSAPSTFAIWVRLAGAVASVLFAITAIELFIGGKLLPTTAPLPSLISVPRPHFRRLDLDGAAGWQLIAPTIPGFSRPQKRARSG